MKKTATDAPGPASRAQTRAARTGAGGQPPAREVHPELPFHRSVGYQIRDTHRIMQRALQARIEREGVTLGMWYFLRVLWEEDGMTQRELSRRVGTMEPTTQSALQTMEAAGFVRRERNAVDKRKLNIYLTPAGRALRARLLPAGVEVVNIATGGLSPREIDLLLGLLGDVQRNLARDLLALGAAEDDKEEGL
jgi:DNA-binding MarR family transcriptional regulator